MQQVFKCKVNPVISNFEKMILICFSSNILYARVILYEIINVFNFNENNHVFATFTNLFRTISESINDLSSKTCILYI